MDVHLDPATPAPVAVVPAAGVVLVHYCEDDTTRAGCRVCPEVTPDLAACYALQAMEAAGVDHDPAEVWSDVRRAVAEQLAWRRTVAGLAAGELVAEPDTAPMTRVLQHAGAPGPLDWHATGWPAGVDQATDRIALPADWRQHTEPAALAPAPVVGESVRAAWVRTAVMLSVVLAVVAVSTGYVVATRPSWAQLPGGTPAAEPKAPAPAGGLTADEPTAGPAPTGGSAGPGRAPGRTMPQPSATPTPAPTSPSSAPTGDVGGRTRVAPPPSPSSSTSSAPAPPADEPAEPAPSSSTSSAAPPVEPDEPAPSSTDPQVSDAPEPTTGAESSPGEG